MNNGIKKLTLKIDRYFFLPSSATNLAICRILLFGYCLLFYRQFEFVTNQSSVWFETFRPVGFFKILRQPLPALALEAISTVWTVTLPMATMGFLTRLSAKLAAISGLILFGYTYNFGTVYHSHHLLVMALMFIGFSRCGDAISLDMAVKRKKPEMSGEYFWPRKMTQVYIALFYFTAGFAKLKTSGLAWAFSENLAIKFFVNAGATNLGKQFAMAPLWFTILSASFVLLVVETGIIVLAFIPRLYPFFFLFLFLFHIGVNEMLGSHRQFMSGLICFCVFVDWQKLAIAFNPKYFQHRLS